MLNQAVKRNSERFPEDFMFQLTNEEAQFLRSQFVTLKRGRGKHHIGPLAQGPGEKIRFPVQGCLRCYPTVNDSTGQEAAQDRVQS
jgi:hypothetical protein